MTEATSEVVSETSADTEAPTETVAAPEESAEVVDFKSKYEAQQKVNRDLERKFKEAATAKDRVSELEAQLAKLEGKEAEYAALQSQRLAEQAALAKANERILKAEVRAAAAGKLSDPEDALRFLDLSALEVGDDGSVDSSVIADLVDKLITTKPYLAAQGGRKFQGSADGGARNDPTKPSQLTKADMARMSPEQIDAAYREGRFDNLLSP